MAERSRTQRSRHREMLLFCGLAIVAAPLLQVLPDHEHVAVRGIDNWVLPPSCPSRSIFGVSCPGCGLTRSFVYLAHGDVEASFRMHRLGWLLMLLAFLQIPYRAYLLWGPDTYKVRESVSKWIGITLIVLLFANWFLGMWLRQ